MNNDHNASAMQATSFINCESEIKEVLDLIIQAALSGQIQTMIYSGTYPHLTDKGYTIQSYFEKLGYEVELSLLSALKTILPVVNIKINWSRPSLPIHGSEPGKDNVF